MGETGLLIGLLSVCAAVFGVLSILCIAGIFDGTELEPTDFVRAVIYFVAFGSFTSCLIIDSNERAKIENTGSNIEHTMCIERAWMKTHMTCQSCVVTMQAFTVKGKGAFHVDPTNPNYEGTVKVGQCYKVRAKNVANNESFREVISLREMKPSDYQ